MKKKIFTLGLAALISLGIYSCWGGNPQVSSDEESSSSVSMIVIEDKTVKVKESLSSVVMENNLISVAFNLDNGSLISVINRQTETDFIKDSVGGNWAMVVDVSTNDPFKTDYLGENAVLVTSRNQEVEYSKKELSNGYELQFVYDVTFNAKGVKYEGIKITETVTLLKGSDRIEFDYKIVNNCNKDIVIVNFTGAQLSGIKDSTHESFSLFWPNKEGKIYEDTVETIMTDKNQSKNLVEVYPSLAAMQLVQLFNNVESMYYFVKDDTREYKTINYGDFTYEGGHDYNQVQTNDKVSLSITQFPFIPSGSSKDLFTSVIGVDVGNKWYKGADVYREFLISSDMVKEVSEFVSSWTGFVPLVGSSYGSKHFASYNNAEGFEVSYPNWVQLADEHGIDTVAVLGWNDGGFDSKYPDYDFATGVGFGGEDGFKEMTTQIHNNGDYIIAHMNSRLADFNGNWSNTVFDESSGILNIHQAGVKLAGFETSLSKDEYENFMIFESYGSGTYYYVMCPGSVEFQTIMNNNVKKLRENGIDGLWFDQLMEKEANLCYDPTHDHDTPATATGSGYKKMFELFEETVRTTGDQEWILVAGGGGNDAYVKWVDVAGGNWNRKLGSRDNSDNSDRHLMSPEIIRYTVPSTYLGLESAGTVAGASDEYARAFLYGDPFLGDPYKPSTGPLVSLYETYPDIFFDGIFKDRVGLTISDENVLATVIVGSNNAIAVQVYNFNTENASNVEINLDLSKLGIDGKITAITNSFSGETVNFSNTKFVIPSLESLEMGSYYVEYN